MIAIDTNILVRILVDDKTEVHQVKLARRFAEKHKLLFVPQLVQAELVWVLDYSFELNKAEIIHVLKHLQENDAFELQHEMQYDAALRLYQESNANFSDCLILEAAKEIGCKLVTFDKKFSKLREAELLT